MAIEQGFESYDGAEMERFVRIEAEQAAGPAPRSEGEDVLQPDDPRYMEIFKAEIARSYDYTVSNRNRALGSLFAMTVDPDNAGGIVRPTYTVVSDKIQ